MSIEVQTLLSSKARKVGASESSSDFQAIFLDALNYSIGDINQRTDQTTAAVATIDATIDLDAQTYQNAISMGVDFYMAENGTWNTQNVDSLRAKYFDQLKWVHTKYLQGIDASVRFGDLDA